jgi:hypothetical protein
MHGSARVRSSAIQCKVIYLTRIEADCKGMDGKGNDRTANSGNYDVWGNSCMNGLDSFDVNSARQSIWMSSANRPADDQPYEVKFIASDGPWCTGKNICFNFKTEGRSLVHCAERHTNDVTRPMYSPERGWQHRCMDQVGVRQIRRGVFSLMYGSQTDSLKGRCADGFNTYTPEMIDLPSLKCYADKQTEECK